MERTTCWKSQQTSLCFCLQNTKGWDETFLKVRFQFLNSAFHCFIPICLHGLIKAISGVIHCLALKVSVTGQMDTKGDWLSTYLLVFQLKVGLKKRFPGLKTKWQHRHVEIFQTDHDFFQGKTIRFTSVTCFVAPRTMLGLQQSILALALLVLIFPRRFSLADANPWPSRKQTGSALSLATNM